MKYPTLIIDNCESVLSDWLLLEYKHAAKIWSGKTVFTNIHKKKDTTKLKSIGSVESKNPKELFSTENCIILDPASKIQLKTDDFNDLNALIVGGILGYEKPRGRTKTLISDKYGFDTRTLGKIQLTIDGAVFVAKAVLMGMKLSEMEIANEIEIVHDSCHSTTLPFGYPVIDNNPIITPGLIDYLNKEDCV